MKCRQKIFFFIINVFLLTIVVSNVSWAVASNFPAMFDFSNQDESTDFYTNLDGEWVFFKEELLTPNETQEKVHDELGEIVSIPDSFEAQTGDSNSFGTYTTKVKIPDEYIGETLAIHIPYQYSAYTLYVDENELAKNGEVGHDSASHTAEMAPKTGYFIPQSDEVLLTMHVSSFDHIRGGFENSLYIGEASVVAQKFNLSMIGTLFVNGSIFIIGLFMVLFALYRRQEHVFFLFGTFSMLISARALFSVPFYYTLIFIDMSWLWGTRLEYMLTEAASMLFVILLWKWHESEFSKKVMYGLVAIHGALIVTTLFTQPVFFQTLFFNVFYLAVPTFFYAIYVITKSIRNNNQTAKVNLVGMGIIFLAFFNDFALGQHWYKSVPLMLPAIGIYIFIHVILMSKNFADSVRKTEQQNKQLLVLNTSNEELAVQLQQEIKQKDDFLANTSHELRNPLHGIINITQSILRNQSDHLDEKTQTDLTLQLSISNHMSRTLEDLLDITRLKEHRIHLQKEPLNLRAISVGVSDMLKVLIENKNIQMEVLIPDDFPDVLADKNRLMQILFNLLHNAVKYTNEGTITVAAELVDEKVHIHVTDTGIGMKEETLKTVFDAYAQNDASITAIGSGLGLGLSICQQLVNMHGGTIQASSSLGEGSVFTFTLPKADDAATEEVSATTPATEPIELPLPKTPIPMMDMAEALTKNRESSYIPTVLVVDDDPVNLKVITNILSEEEYDVTTVTSGQDALKQVTEKEWDLVISDVMMPTMSGYELTRSIRKNYALSELPILLLTARSNQEDIYTGFLAGANDYVIKPVDAMELNIRVHALTDLKASIKERLSMEAAWLHAQIRPHFLLNTLNAIVSLSETDTERMANLIDKLTHYLQSSFYLKNVDELVPLKYELELLESYLYIEKERFGDRLQIHWDIEEVENITIPPLSIQTLVENAVNHGVLAKIDGGLITIRIRKKDDHTNITIIDDGVGMDERKINEIFSSQPDREQGIGLVNTEQRLKRLYGKGLQINSTPGVGTTITFQVNNLK